MYWFSIPISFSASTQNFEVPVGAATGSEVRERDLESGGPGLKSRSDH